MRDVPSGAPSPPITLEIVVPARNEADRLPEGLATLCAKLRTLPFGCAVIVVDNGSTDATAAVVRAWRSPIPVRLVQCPPPGKGAAVRAGLLATRAALVGFCDADMATDLSGLDTALGLLMTGHQVVVGSRALPASVVQARSDPLRALGALVFRRIVRRMIVDVTDTQCGFKFFAGPIARQAAASLGSTGFAFDVELLARCRDLGAAIDEIPVIWRDVPGSSFSVRRHSFTCLRELTTIWRTLRAEHAAARRAAGRATSLRVLTVPRQMASVLPPPLPQPDLPHRVTEPL
ncbi:MAG: glycosyltransferase [Streptosporangiales bacterium]|nr:glycosyltransferase [Streptosporangiales bacterium]